MKALFSLPAYIEVMKKGVMKGSRWDWAYVCIALAFSNPFYDTFLSMGLKNRARLYEHGTALTKPGSSLYMLCQHRSEKSSTRSSLRPGTEIYEKLLLLLASIFTVLRVN